MIRGIGECFGDSGLGFPGRLEYPERPAIVLATRHPGGRILTEDDHDGTTR
jgi:hypothetical protein